MLACAFMAHAISYFESFPLSDGIALFFEKGREFCWIWSLLGFEPVGLAYGKSPNWRVLDCLGFEPVIFAYGKSPVGRLLDCLGFEPVSLGFCEPPVGRVLDFLGLRQSI